MGKLLNLLHVFENYWNARIVKYSKYQCFGCELGFDSFSALFNHTVKTNHGWETKSENGTS